MGNELLNIECQNNKLIFKLSNVNYNQAPVLAIDTFEKTDHLYSYVIELQKEEGFYSISLLELIKFLEINKTYHFGIYSQDKKSNNFSEFIIKPTLTNNKFVICNFHNTDILIEAVIDKNLRFFAITKKVNKPFYVKPNDGNLLSFDLQTNASNYKLQMARRNSTAPNYVYDAFVDIKQQDLNKQELFKKISEYVTNAGEIWDVVAVISEMYFPLILTENLNDNYSPVNDGFNGKFISSTNRMLSIYISLGKNKNQSKIKVCVIGTCYAKLPLHSIEYMNADYKKFYENGLIIFHSSFISMMSKKIDFDPSTISKGGDQKMLKLYGRQEYDKDAIEKIIAYKPDYILIDLFIESRGKLCRFSDNQYITDVYFYNGTEQANIIKDKEKLLPNDVARFALFQEAVKAFREKLKGIIPLKNIVLLESHAAREYYDENRKILSFQDNKWVENSDKLWDKYNSLFVQIIPECRIIDTRKKEYYGDKNNPLSFSTNYFETSYYKDVLNQFNKIVLQDFIANRK